MDSGYLPEELVILILEKLPPATIRRFRSVCKSWCCIISAPDFLERSILLQCKRRETSLAITERSGDKPAGLIVPSSCSPTELPSLPRHPDKLGRLLVVGSCRGIVCLTDRDMSNWCAPYFRDRDMSKWCALWNPTTGESRVLPKHDHYTLTENIHRLSWRFRFGHHDGKWKVVKILEDLHRYYVQYWAWIYEVGSDSWKKMSPDGIDSRRCFLRDNGFNRTAACWRDGRVNSWMACRRIVSFDMANEAFSTDHNPNFPIPDGSSLLTLNNLLSVRFVGYLGFAAA